MQHDEWDEKAQEIAGGIINPDSVMRYTSKQDAAEWIANLAREAYQRGRNVADRFDARAGEVAARGLWHQQVEACGHTEQEAMLASGGDWRQYLDQVDEYLSALVAPEREAGFAAGQEAMRERAAKVSDTWTDDEDGLEAFTSHGIAEAIRALPLTPKES